MDNDLKIILVICGSIALYHIIKWLYVEIKEHYDYKNNLFDQIL